MADFNAEDISTAFAIAEVGNGRIHRTGELIYFSAAQTSRVIYRGYDSGLGQFVTWIAPTLAPLSTDTTPPFTGSLSDVHIEAA